LEYWDQEVAYRGWGIGILGVWREGKNLIWRRVEKGKRESKERKLKA